MANTIEVINPVHNPNQIKIGDRTVAFMQSQTKLDEDSKDIIIEEAIKILSHCTIPGRNGHITNIAVGYVQSGKTLSFTTLTALAADNGYRMVIYLTGTKNNLQSQTSERLRNDLKTDEGDDYIIVDTNESIFAVDDYIYNFLETGQEVLLFPILKHYLHINRLADIFSAPTLVTKVKQCGVLIIDDEADQSRDRKSTRLNSSH